MATVEDIGSGADLFGGGTGTGADPEQWRDFFENLRPRLVELEQSYPHEQSLLVEYVEMEHFSTRLTGDLAEDPRATLEVGEEVLNAMKSPEVKGRLHLHIGHLLPLDRISIRELREIHLGRYLALEGIITRVTEVRPRVKFAIFECQRCGERQRVEQQDLVLEEPVACELCNREQNRSTQFRLIENLSEFVDTQRIEIQENPEGLRGGAQPERIWAMAEFDNCGTVFPGDRVVLNGILSTKPRRQGGNQSTVFDIHLDLNCIEHMQYEFEEIEITEEEEKEIRELAGREDVLDVMVNSLAPTIHGLNMEKMALLFQMFGGVRKEYRDAPNVRGDIHILMVGDPGVAKSQLLRYVSMLSPRAMYASGQSTSKAGLTASAVKDSDMDGRFVLEAGVLVMADLGIACIDELDKMDKKDRSSMLEALEQQTISVSKAGINATLQTRCSLLAAANPRHGRFDPYAESLASQVNLPPELLSRFDAIFFLEDRPERGRDALLANFILSMHQRGEKLMAETEPGDEEGHTLSEVTHDSVLPKDLIRKYVAFAKRNCIPILQDDARDRLQDFYVGLRATHEEGQAVPITPRQLEAIIRLAEASARVRLSPEVAMEDASNAIDIFQYWLTKVATDPDTGQIDLGWVTTGERSSQVNRMRGLKEIIRALSPDYPNGVPDEELTQAAAKEGIDESGVADYLQRMKDNGEIYNPRQGLWRLL